MVGSLMVAHFLWFIGLPFAIAYAVVGYVLYPCFSFLYFGTFQQLTDDAGFAEIALAAVLTIAMTVLFGALSIQILKKH